MIRLLIFILLLPQLLIAGQGMYPVPMVYQSVDTSAPLVSWDGGDSAGTQSTLNVYAENGGTISATNVTFTGDGADSTGHSAAFDATSTLAFVCTDGNSIDLNKGTIEFDMKLGSGAVSYAVLFNLGTGSNDFGLRFYSSIYDPIQFRYNGNRVQYSIGSEFSLDTWVHVVLRWDNTPGAEIHTLTLNNTTYAGSFVSGSALGTTKPTPTGNNMYIGQQDTQYHLVGSVDNFKIYNYVLP